MRKSGLDPKVKKSLVRNYEQKVPKLPTQSTQQIAGPSKSCCINILQSKNDNDLNQPALCSSEVLASYLSKAKKDLPSTLSADNLKTNKAHLSSNITKKLNFHFNDRIYKNLVELNADAANVRSKKEKKTLKPVTSIKKDVEPNIEDFCNKEKEDDLCPDIPIVIPVIKKTREFEGKELHNLVASFENL